MFCQQNSSIFDGSCVEITVYIGKKVTCPSKLLFPFFFPHAWSAFNFGPHGPMGPLFLGITQSSRCDWAPLHTPWAKGSSCSGNASRLGPKALATGRQKGGGGFVIHPHVDCEAENAGKEKQH